MIVLVGWRVDGLVLVLLFGVIFALESSRGRQLGSCWRYGVVPSIRREGSSIGESLITRASRFDEGVTSCTARKRLYCFFFFLSVLGGDSGFSSSSNGRGDSGISCISSSSAPDFASSDVLVGSLRSSSPKSKRSIALSTAADVLSPPKRFRLCAGDGSWM